MKIETLKARQILDSRGTPTVAATATHGDISATVRVPSGASTGSHEALELRDGDPSYYFGKSVRKAVHNIQALFDAVRHLDMEDLSNLDQTMIELDGTANKSTYGANAILAISMASVALHAAATHLPLYSVIHRHYQDLGGTRAPSLPTPMCNVINGGKHASSGLSIQEFMLIPNQAPYPEQLRMCAETFHTLKDILHDRGLSTAVGDEGGFAPPLQDSKEVFELLTLAVKEAGYEASLSFAIDAAANEFYTDGSYLLDGTKYSTLELVEYMKQLQEAYPIVSLEDPFQEDDWEGFSLLTKAIGDNRMIVGDDLFVTQTPRLRKGLEQGACNSILIKLNQVGSVSETLTTIVEAQHAGFETIISHRSGETSDTFIADLAVATGSRFIKTGSMSRSERLAKYNRLLEIHEELTAS